jgi:membrane protein YdbS with pleckstrin-like domain
LPQQNILELPPNAANVRMITSQGYGLIAELIAAALLIAALTGLFVHRSKSWLVGATMAFVILTVAATVVIASSS